MLLVFLTNEGLEKYHETLKSSNIYLHDGIISKTIKEGYYGDCIVYAQVCLFVFSISNSGKHLP